MLRIAIRLAAATSLAGAGLCAALWTSRRTLIYNDQGRYFDAETTVVLHQQSVVIYGALALLLALLAIMLWLASKRI
ncbi:hypothetical protein [uncultured Erythrobacter sp.]|uniref:hypothetical protein n=1 Tax=uncultured Erythrobacter sp. TaxID=263913 RepID=UPI00263802BE|nr:hypothetical protein [uncultured Erythrobacter sp.]